MVVPTTQMVVGITKDDAGKALGIVSGIHKAIQKSYKILMPVGIGVG